MRHYEQTLHLKPTLRLIIVQVVDFIDFVGMQMQNVLRIYIVHLRCGIVRIRFTKRKTKIYCILYSLIIE